MSSSLTERLLAPMDPESQEQDGIMLNEEEDDRRRNRSGSVWVRLFYAALPLLIVLVLAIALVTTMALRLVSPTSAPPACVFVLLFLVEWIGVLCLIYSIGFGSSTRH